MGEISNKTYIFIKDSHVTHRRQPDIKFLIPNEVCHRNADEIDGGAVRWQDVAISSRV